MAASVRRRARTNGTVQSQPLIAVRDVKASSGWYRQLLNLKSGHGGREYERLLCDGELVMQLHAWNAEEHPNLTDPDAAPPGHGVLLWFEPSDFDAPRGSIEHAWARARDVTDRRLLEQGIKREQLIGRRRAGQLFDPCLR